MKRKLVLILILLVCNTAKAEVADLLIVRSPDTVFQSQLDLWREGAARTSEVGKRIRLVSVNTVEDVLNQNSTTQYVKRIFSWVDFAYRNKHCVRTRLCLMVLPPVYDQFGESYGGGAAGAICTNHLRNIGRKFSYAIIREKNGQGLDRREHSRISVLHEILHNLGANHAEKTNVMHPAALTLVDTVKRLPIFPITKRQVKYCDQGKTPAGRFTRRSFITHYDPPFL